MGEVYRARDSRLGREVAIKVLPQDVSADRDRVARFEREARLLASLNHPNIAHIYGFEEANGESYLSMELVEGPTLADRLSGGALPIEEALPLFTQLAEGLEAAHESGVIHRDLKPANLKVTERGMVKILDFGLAKALEDWSKHTGETITLASPNPDRTQEGQILGTPAYMSPEQARGQAVDKRTDIWAFGCCLYEALAGKRPFRGETLSDLIAEILKSEPDWDALPPETPSNLLLLMERCLEKDLSRRFRDMGDVVIRLEEATTEMRRPESDLTLSGTGQTQESPDHGNRRNRLGLLSAVAFSLVFVAVLGVFLGRAWNAREMRGPSGSNQSGTEIRALAVLPFENRTGDEAQEYFVDGMTDALSAELGKIHAVRVISRTSSMRYKGTDKGTVEISKELGVDALIEGSVMRVGDDIRITAQIVDGRRDAQIWGQSFTGTLDGILKLQSNVALQIARRINAEVTPDERRRIRKSQTIDPETHDLYLRARQAAQDRSRAGLQSAIALFKEANRIDPGFAPALVGIANTISLQIQWSYVSPEEALPELERNAKSALEHDPDLGAAYTALASAGEYRHEWAEAERLHRRGIELSPSHSIAYLFYARLLFKMGRLEEAHANLDLAAKLDPYEINVHGLRAGILRDSGKPEAALAELRPVFEIEPDHVPSLLVATLSLLQLGRTDEAYGYLNRLESLRGASALTLGLRAMINLRAGDADGARKTLDAAVLESRDEAVPAWTIPAAYAQLGDLDSAFEWLNRCIDSMSPEAVYLRESPLWAPLRDDPRYEAALRRLNFPEVGIESPEP